MDVTNPFALPGQWYKGALHAHTTNSDGKLAPADSAQAHRDAGYHFLAITDHNVITDLSAYNGSGFLTIPGVEVAYDHNPVHQSYHIVVLGVREILAMTTQTPVQAAIDRWRAAGALLFLAHPYWSGMTWAEMMPLEGLAGTEVFNTSAHTDLGKGLSAAHWDDALARGKRWWGFAVDDTHGINDDFHGGWVWVKSERLDTPAILQALAAGAFYSTSGPTIHDFRIVDGVARVRCSPVTAINLIGHTQWGFQQRAAPGETITEAEWALKGRKVYLRAECVDAQGRTAWSNPIFLG